MQKLLYSCSFVCISLVVLKLMTGLRYSSSNWLETRTIYVEQEKFLPDIHSPRWSNTTLIDRNGRKFRSEESFFAYREAEYRKRSLRLKNFCQQHPEAKLDRQSSTYKKSFNTLLYVKFYKLAYCPNAKVGTSTWGRYFAMTIDFNVTQKRSRQFSLHNYVKVQFPWPRGELDIMESFFRSSFSFMFVRHPFVRLVSCYQDKIIDAKSAGTFRGIRMNYTREPKETRKYPKYATFTEFVEHLLEGNFEHNLHVLPYFHRCRMCNRNYDVIGFLETGQEDVEYIMRRTGLKRAITQSHNTVNWHVSSEGSTEELTKEYFAQLTETHYQKLKEKYILDFLAFGYNPEEYHFKQNTSHY